MARLKRERFRAKKHILVAQDTLTRFPITEILPSAALQSSVISVLNKIYAIWCPQTQRMDNGLSFNSAAFQEFFNTLELTATPSIASSTEQPCSNVHEAFW